MLPLPKALTPRTSFFGHPGEQGGEPGEVRTAIDRSLGLDELRALQHVDLSLPPELAEPNGQAWSSAGTGDLMRLGPPPGRGLEASGVNAAVGRVLEAFEHRRSQPGAATPEAAIKEAKMIAVLGQIHRLRLDIASKSRRPA